MRAQPRLATGDPRCKANYPARAGELGSTPK
jgi:hypothetical protein